MSRLTQPTPEEEAEWKEWVASRPDSVRIVAEKLDPWTLYRMKSTGNRCTLISIFENGTVKVSITGEFNAVMFDREVFGIDPGDLEPCDPPSADEATGAMLSPDQVDGNVDALRVMVRSDLFEMNEQGEAVRR